MACFLILREAEHVTPAPATGAEMVSSDSTNEVSIVCGMIF